MGMMNSDEFLRQLGVRFRSERRKAGLSQDALAKALGHKGSASHAYVSKLEQGAFRNVNILTVVRYLQACKAPIGKFMLELAQSGAFGEAEQGLVVVDYSSSSSLKLRDEKRAKAKLLYEKRWLRETRDAEIVAELWREIQPAIWPLLPTDPTRRFVAPYLEGVRTFYKAWKLATRGAMNRDPTFEVQMAFDRVEQAGLEARLTPAAVHKMREIVFDRLMRMMPRGGNT
jgi:transcriptional regulator with XRE-family HTH domain